MKRSILSATFRVVLVASAMLGCGRQEPIPLQIVVPSGYRGPIAIFPTNDQPAAEPDTPVRWFLNTDGQGEAPFLALLRTGVVIECAYADGSTLPVVNPSADEVALRGGDIVGKDGEEEVLRYFVGTKAEYKAFSYDDWREYLRKTKATEELDSPPSSAE